MSSLFIYMNGLDVGEYRQSSSGAQSFNYSDSWIDRNNPTPLSLSMPLTQKKHQGDVVYNYFDNLLPDSLEIRNRIQARVNAKTNRPFDLLNKIGNDCVGAIQLLEEHSAPNIKSIKSMPVDEQTIANNLDNYRTLPLGMSDTDDFRISLAGAQEKTAYLKLDGKWHRPIGATPTTHIFKLPIGKNGMGVDLSDSVENEWICLKILKAFDLPVAEAEMGRFKDKKVLIVERFDRQFSENKSWIIRHPQEDMCQVLSTSPGLKYEQDGGPDISNIMDTLNGATQPQNDRYQFMKTLFIFWLPGATDGHAKNFSVFLKPLGRYQLTPIYDVLSTYPLIEKKQLEFKKIKMALALHSKNTHYKWHAIQHRHWLSQADKVRFPNQLMFQIIDEVYDALEDVIKHVTDQLSNDFPADVSDPIFENMRKLKQQYTKIQH